MSDSTGKTLDTRSLTFLVIASMVGAGVYTTSGFAMADLKEPGLVIVAWTIGGVVAICGATGYAMLAKRLTENGGEYLYLTRYVHPAAGFVAGWVSLLAGFTGGGAFAAAAFDSYAWPEPSRPSWLPPGSLAMVLIAACTAMHALHPGRGVVAQNGIVIVKLLLIASFVILAYCLSSRWQSSSLDFAAGDSDVTLLTMATSVMWISLSYSGFNAAIYVAGDASGGAVSVGRSMILATVVVTILYLALNVIFVRAPAMELIIGRQDIATVAAHSLGGDALALAVRITICLGLASSVSSVILAGPRVYSRMADDGVFPKFFGATEAAPVRAVVLQGVLIAVAVCAAGLQSMLSYLGMTLSITTAATVATLFLPALRGGETRSWTLIVPAVYVVATLGIASLAGWNNPVQGYAAVLTIGVGIAAYAASRVRLKS